MQLLPPQGTTQTWFLIPCLALTQWCTANLQRAVHLQLLQKEHWGGERQYSCTYLTVTLEEHHWCSQYRLYFIHLLSPLLNDITEVAKLTHFLGSRRQPGNPWDIMAFPKRNSNQKSQFNSWSITRTNSKQMPYRKWQLAMSANCLGSKSLKHRVRKMNQACNCPIISLCWWHDTTYFLKTSKLVTNKWQQIHFWFISFNNSWFISQSSLTYAEFLSKILLLTQKVTLKGSPLSFDSIVFAWLFNGRGTSLFIFKPEGVKKLVSVTKKKVSSPEVEYYGQHNYFPGFTCSLWI